MQQQMYRLRAMSKQADLLSPDYTTFILGSKQTFTVCTDEADEKHLGSCAV